MSDQIKAPWTPEQVAHLNDFQESGVFHPFTCGNRENHPPERYYLIATVRGWICPFCDYRQDWAHAIMANPEAVKRQKELIQALGRKHHVVDDEMVERAFQAAPPHSDIDRSFARAMLIAALATPLPPVATGDGGK